MNYEQTMKQYALEIQKTNKKIQMYIGGVKKNSVAQQVRYSPYRMVLLQPRSNGVNNNSGGISRVKARPHLRSEQVCCLTVSPQGREVEGRHKTSQSVEYLGGKQQRSYRQLRQNVVRKPSAASVRQDKQQLPGINYQANYTKNLIRQVQISKLIKYQTEVANRMEDIEYVQKGISQFPYGNEHFRIMERVMARKEAIDRKNQQILLRFHKDAQKFKKERSTAIRLANRNLQLKQHSFIHSQPIAEQPDQTNQQEQQVESIYQSKGEVNDSMVAATQSIDQTSALKSIVPLNPEQVRAISPKYSQADSYREQQAGIRRVHRVSRGSEDSRMERGSQRVDDLKNVRKHLQLLKRRRYQREQSEIKNSVSTLEQVSQTGGGQKAEYNTISSLSKDV